jgi:CBS domain containing-hemolysin-like protein
VQGSWWERVWHNDLWYAIPLIVAIALVYAATRHELIPQILRHALRVARWIAVFMLVLLGILVTLSWFQ